ncbi:polarity establishment/cellular polarization [Vanrija albida]|uniref:Polarity establishment/cellular polarization n=1 Tax=Vanrija albida TaxID=181172 RepID=A0ABR3Q8Q6_9TREE
MRCGLVVFLALWAWGVVVTAAPVLNLAINSQLPPVARVGTPYVFTLLANTFTSAETVQFNTSTLPTWLQFAPAVATFYGTPSAADVGPFNVSVIAFDSTGSATAPFSGIVTDLAAPVVHQGFAAQIANPESRDFASVDVMPGDSGITVHPHWSFSIGWNGDTFRKATTGKTSTNNLYYQARLRGATSLPDWIQFSNTTFTFNGVAPASGSYPITVTGTDFWGFTAAESSFVLSVGDGPAIELNSKNPWAPLNTVTRGHVNYKFDPSDVLINGTAATWSQVVVTPNLTNFKWLSFDNTTGSIIGTTPDSLVNGTVAPLSIPVTISSTPSNDTLTFSSFLEVNVVPYFFSAFALPNTTTAAGSNFQFDLSPYLLNKTADIHATVIPKEAASWLIYYPENHTLIGVPPVNISYSGFDVTFNGTLNSASATTALNVNITGIQGPQGTGEPAPVPIGSVHHGLSKKNKIIIGCVVGIVGGLIVLLLLLVLCCRRRNKNRAETGQPLDPDHPSKDSAAANYAASIISEQEQAKSRAMAALTALATAAGLGRLLPAPKKNEQAWWALAPPTPSTVLQTPGGKSIDSEATVAQSPIKVSKASPDKAQRLGAIQGLFANDFEKAEEEPQEKLGSEPQLATADSFVGQPEVLGVRGLARPFGEPIAEASPVDTVDANKVTAVDAVGAVNIGGSARRNSFESFSDIGSRASWESEKTFHWSDESNYLEPLPVGPSSRIRGGPSNSQQVAASAQVDNAGAEQATELTNVPRPKQGFYPRFPRNVRPGERPYIPNDTFSSYSQFSEFRDDSARSLNSFADPGSAFGSNSTGSHNGSGSQGPRGGTSSSSLGSRAWNGEFPPVSALARLASSTFASAATVSSEGPVAFATAERRSLDTQRVVYPASNAAPASPSPVRRFSSSRRTMARVSAHAERPRVVSTHITREENFAENSFTEDFPSRAVRAGDAFEDADAESVIVFSGPVSSSTSTFGRGQ